MTRTTSRERKAPQCNWCGKGMPTQTRGRPRKYCSAACKQRAWEQRHNVVGTPIPQDAVIMTPDKAAAFQDGLFELRCGAEDVATAAGEGASAEEIQQLCEELVAVARRLEDMT